MVRKEKTTNIDILESEGFGTKKKVIHTDSQRTKPRVSGGRAPSSNYEAYTPYFIGAAVILAVSLPLLLIHHHISRTAETISGVVGGATEGTKEAITSFKETTLKATGEFVNLVKAPVKTFTDLSLGWKVGVFLMGVSVGSWAFLFVVWWFKDKFETLGRIYNKVFGFFSVDKIQSELDEYMGHNEQIMNELTTSLLSQERLAAEVEDLLKGGADGNKLEADEFDKYLRPGVTLNAEVKNFSEQLTCLNSNVGPGLKNIQEDSLKAWACGFRLNLKMLTFKFKFIKICISSAMERTYSTLSLYANSQSAAEYRIDTKMQAQLTGKLRSLASAQKSFSDNLNLLEGKFEKLTKDFNLRLDISSMPDLANLECADLWKELRLSQDSTARLDAIFKNYSLAIRSLEAESGRIVPDCYKLTEFDVLAGANGQLRLDGEAELLKAGEESQIHKYRLRMEEEEQAYEPNALDMSFGGLQGI